MKITIIAVGQIRGGPEADLIAEYQKRLPWQLEIIEVEEKKPLPALERKKSEGDKLVAHLPKGAFVIAMDKEGGSFSSRELSKKIEKWFSAGGAHIAFLIGGSDGLSEAALKAAHTKLSFGPMTWPHQLARVMLLEQIYRAWAIRQGHPYHK
jgi:23S rRNA (pseudouridine1915-N3)-methyltransferase